MTLRFICSFVLAGLLATGCRAQELPQSLPQSNPPSSALALPDSPAPKTRPQDQHPPRVFWIIPTFAVTESKAPTKLTPRQKLSIVLKGTADPYTIGFTALTAGISQANNSMAGYGQGTSGYAKRFGAAYADQASQGFFGAFLLASALHQDPRYYRQGSGPFPRRFAHALIRPVATYTDGDGRAFNWSGILGSLAASGLSNAYYPDEERGAGKTFSRWATGIPFSVIDHLVDEFGPDLQRKLTRKKEPVEPIAGRASL
jgi:hypothetical protein